MSGVPCVTSVVGMDAFAVVFANGSYPLSQHSRREEICSSTEFVCNAGAEITNRRSGAGSVEFVGSFAKV
jgi:hypothetical protein